MSKFIQRNLIVLVVGAATVAALVWPAGGLALKRAGLTTWMIAAIFVCQGAGLDGRQVRDVGHHLRALTWGFIVSQVAAPVFAWGAVVALGWQGADRVGFVLACAMAPTLVSGIVIATAAGGDRATAIILTVGLNLVAVLTVPLTLGWSLGATVALDRWGLLRQLVLLILVPSLLGQGLRLARPRWAAARQKVWQLAPVLLLGVVIYVSLAERVGDLRALTAWRLVQLVVPALAVHVALLVLAYAGARWPWRFPEAAARALALVCSQKTLPVAVAVWSTVFAADWPLAILPPIAYHMTQTYFDGVLARFWGAHPAAGPTAPAARDARDADAEAEGPPGNAALRVAPTADEPPRS